MANANLPDIEDLRQERHHKLRSAKDICDRAEKASRVLTEDEQRDIADLTVEAETIEKQIAALQKDADTRARVAASLEANAKPQQRIGKPIDIQDQDCEDGKPKIEFTRYGKLQAFSGNRAEERAYRAGQWVRAAIYKNESAKRYCRENGIEIRAHSEGVNTAGGYLVPNEMSQAIIDLREQYGVFRRNCKVVPMGRDTMTVPRRAGGLTAYFVGEGVAITESDKSWDAVQMTAKKLGILTRYSTELAEDAIIGIADDLAQEAAYAFAYKEDLCGFNGDGTSTYGGIYGIVPQFEAGTTLAGYVDCATTGHDTFAEVDATDLTTLMGKLPQYARMGAKWYCSQVAYDLVFSRLALTAGGNTIQSVSGAFTPSFLGYPIEVSQVLLSAVTAQDNKVLLMFGNLGMAATLGDRREITIGLSDQKYWAEDQIGLKATERVDINVHSLGDTTNAGPVVALIGKTS